MIYVTKREFIDAIQVKRTNLQEVIAFLVEHQANFEVKRDIQDYLLKLSDSFVPFDAWIVVRRDSSKRVQWVSNDEFHRAFEEVPYEPSMPPTPVMPPLRAAYTSSARSGRRFLDIRSLRPAEITLGALQPVSDRALLDRYGAILTTRATDGPRPLYGITFNGYECKKNHNGHLAVLTGLPDNWSVLLTETGEKAFEKFYVSEGLAVFEMP